MAIDLRSPFLSTFEMTTRILLIAAVLFCTSARADRGSDIRFKNFYLDHGLSQSTVYNFVQDDQGFIWVGTQDGLNKFDGYSFKVYRHDPEDPHSLSGNFIFCQLKAQNGDLWIGTNAGLNRFERLKERFIHYPLTTNDSESRPSYTVKALIESGDGHIWVGTRNRGLIRFNPATGSVKHYRHQSADPNSISNNRIRAMIQDSTGAIWIGTSNGGLNRFDQSTETFTHFMADTAAPGSLSHNSIDAIFEDAKGTLWIGTDGGGLNRFNREKETFTVFKRDPNVQGSLSGDFVSSIIEDSGKHTGTRTLWIGTRNGGLNRFHPATQRFTHYQNEPDNFASISYSYIRSIFEDRAGNIWVGTGGGGVNVFDNVTRIKTLRSQDLKNAKNYGLTVDDQHQLWIATDGLGLIRVDLETNAYQKFNHIPDDPNSLGSNMIFAVYRDSTNTLWIGGRNGLSRFDNTAEEFENFTSISEIGSESNLRAVLTILDNARGGLWIGSQNDGLYTFNRASKIFSRPQLGGKSLPEALLNCSIYALQRDRAGNTWIGTDEYGLYRVDPELRTIETFSHRPNDPQSLSHNFVLSITEDTSGVIWIGTYGGGLNKLNPKTGSFTRYQTADGLPNDTVYGILEDQSGMLWMSTNHGVSKFDPQTSVFHNLDQKDGLQNNEFNAWSYDRDDAGRLYFGGPNGVNIIDPGNIHTNSHQADVVITKFLLNYETVEVASLSKKNTARGLSRHINSTEEIELNHDQDSFAFEFSLLNFRQSEKNRFQYKLEGYDTRWIETDSQNRRANYTDLPSGEYTFWVKAANDDGIWSDRQARLKLTIHPAPWATWWAYVIYTFLSIAIAVLIAQAQRRKFLRKQRELDREKRVTQQLRELDKLKSEILANVSHELRTPLNGIIGIAESLVDGFAIWSEAKIQSNLAMIYSSGKRLASLVNDILDFSKIRDHTLTLERDPVDLKVVADLVLNTSLVLVGQKNIKVSNQIKSSLPCALADEARLQQILYNLVGNAIKFTESGEIAISARARDDALEICVSDTGIGIAKDQQERIFGSFEQIDSGAARQYGGTGLGLAVTKQLVELHQGRIWVESTPDRGSKFYFTLPTTDGFAAQKTPSEKTLVSVLSISPAPFLDTDSIEADEPAAPVSGCFSVLVVDDDPVNLEVLANHLSQEHYTITRASSGRQALNLLKNDHNYDIVLLDVMMPQMTGYEVAERIRQRHARHELPIIFLTAKNQVSDLIAGFSAGGNDYLVKPIGKAELLSRVQTHLQLLETNRSLEHKIRAKSVELQQSLREIQQTERHLSSALEQAKTSELATNVLHNVGNVISSVNISIQLIQDMVSHQNFTILDDVVTQLKNQETNELDDGAHDPRMPRLTVFLEKLADQWRSKRAHAIEEIAHLQSSIEHLASLVSAQQNYAKLTSTAESVSLATLVQTAIDMSEVRKEAGAIDVMFDPINLPPINLETHKAIQILINMLNNAVHSLRAAKGEDKSLNVVLERADANTVRIGVIDNGLGIEKTNLDKVFQSGFTTKPSGHGHGLHSSSSLAEEMGGRLTCHSDGPGTGASFYLYLPASAMIDQPSVTPSSPN